VITVKAITLWEPWASLVARNEKKIETRSWKTKYRGPLAIHAAASVPKWVRELCPKFGKLLGIKDYNGSWLYYLEHGVGPFGKVVATCRLVDCFEITEIHGRVWAINPNGSNIHIEGNEKEFGDYTSGRYAWILEDTKPLTEPISAKGKQRLWNWDERMV
jgi:activating signal cointegrator 1